jgi:pimeloyl-ACP methyl ester carboxylesterase
MPVSAGIYYYSYQDRDTDTPPVVLLHGAGGTHLSWPPEVRRLHGYRVYALDLPGHGKSQAQSNQQTIQAYASLVLDWLAALQLGRAVFVGHSMGSAIALSLAIDHPRHVLGIGLIGSGVRLRVHPDFLVAAASSTTYLKAIQAVVGRSFSPNTAPRLVELAAKRMQETRQSVFYADLLACNTFDVSGQITQVSQPALVVCGLEDQMTPPRYSQYLADAIPGARLQLIPAAGHMVMLEQPQALAEALQTWLKTFPFHPGEAE